MWDLALLRSVPGIRIAAPRDEATLRSAFREAIEVADAPTVVRYPKGELGAPLPTLERGGKALSRGGIDVLAARGKDPRVVVFGMGAMVATAAEVGDALAEAGVPVRVATATWVIPVPTGLTDAIRGADIVVTIEDGLVEGGIGEAWAEVARTAGNRATWLHHGIPRAFLDHASRAQLVESVGLDAKTIARSVFAALGK
jgi:1-deoxy-D-xylulose-5-phosphate synthase